MRALLPFLASSLVLLTQRPHDFALRSPRALELDGHLKTRVPFYTAQGSLSERACPITHINQIPLAF